MRQIPALYSFNHGIVSALGLARSDQKRVALAAEIMENWMPRILGSMSLRPGFGFLAGIFQNVPARFLRFIFSTTDCALVELTNTHMRVWINDAVLTRPSVSTAITNGAFPSDLTGWTDDDEAGGVSAWVSPGYMGLTGTGDAAAIRTQQVTVGAGDIGVEHALYIIIKRGPVTLRVGSTNGGDEYITETALETGEHSLALTPSGNFYIRFQSRLARIVYVQSVAIQSGMDAAVASPWPTAALDSVTYDQSGDILFVAANGYQQRKISRRATHSWSIEIYQPLDGPFRKENIGPITLASSVLTGNGTLTASSSLFRATHIGALFTLSSTGQEVAKSISAQNVFSSAIEVTSVTTGRDFLINITGLTSTGTTVTLQRSYGVPGVWADNASYTTDQTNTLANDGFNNQIVFYRIGVKTGDYSTGTIVVSLTSAVGTIRGVARITAFSSATQVDIEVLSDFGGTGATAIWSEGSWSDFRGWPTAVRLHEGRLCWSGRNGFWDSVSDSFESFDPDFPGDAGPINRTIGSGPVDTINWMLSLQRLILGAQGAEFSVRSSSLDEPLTPTNLNIKPASTQGSSAVEPVVIDKRGAFVDRSGIKVFEIAFDAPTYDYGSNDLTLMVPELGLPGIVRMAVQRKPDTRIHCVRSDGVVMIAVSDKLEEVLCWLTVTTDGLIEDVVILPGPNGSTDDQVYYVVNRALPGSPTNRYLEKWAKETECRGGSLNKQADAFVTYSGVPTNIINGLDHLEGLAVIAWGDGADLSPGVGAAQTTYTVSGGQITLPVPVSNAVVGLPYSAPWKSAKLALQVSAVQTTLAQTKEISHLGLILAYAHPKGLQFGPDFDNLDDMPEVERGVTINKDTIRTAYDEQEFEFPVTWTTDLRLCLQATAPRPVTVLAAVPDLQIHN